MRSPETEERIRLEKLLEPGFGVVLPLPQRDSFFLASRQRWTPVRLAALRRVCGPKTSVEIPPEFDSRS